MKGSLPSGRVFLQRFIHDRGQPLHYVLHLLDNVGPVLLALCKLGAHVCATTNHSTYVSIQTQQ